MGSEKAPTSPKHGTMHTLLFAAAICIVCSLVVSVAAVGLASKQETNRALDRQRKVLVVARLMAETDKLSPAEIDARFGESIRARIVDLQSGDYDDSIDAESFDPRSEDTRPAPANDAKVRELPRRMRVYQVVKNNRVRMVILPVRGRGLWSTLHGYLALDTDGNTVVGITFYQHGETPGLGGEVDNAKWKERWRGRKLFDEHGQLRLAVAKGAAGPPDSDPHRVDGLSGSTLTSRGVSNMLSFWMGESGFGPYLERLQRQGAEP